MKAETSQPKKEYNLGFRVTEATKNKLIRAAAKDNRKQSDMARLLLERALDELSNGSSESEQRANKQEQQAA